MSTSVLEKLKVKPSTNNIEQFMVKIHTTISDKTKDKLVNREEFIKKLKRDVFTKIPEEKSPENIVPTKAAPPAKKAKKIAKKLKLEGDKESGDVREPGARRTAKPKMDVIADDIDLLNLGLWPFGNFKHDINAVLVKLNQLWFNNRSEAPLTLV